MSNLVGRAAGLVVRSVHRYGARACLDRVCARIVWASLAVFAQLAQAQVLPEAGTQIDSRASGLYFEMGSLRQRTLYSNAVSLTVQAVPALALSAGQQQSVGADGSALFFHTVTNTGNVVSGYQLDFSSASCPVNGATILPESVYWDVNQDGQIGAEDVLLTTGMPDSVWALPGQSLRLALRFEPPAMIGVGNSTGTGFMEYCSRIDVTTGFPGVSAYAVNRLSMTPLAEVQLTLTADPAGSASMTTSLWRFQIQAKNVGGQAASPTTKGPTGAVLMVDGSAQSNVLLHMDMAHTWGLQPGTLRTTDPSAQFLYRYEGDATGSYSTQERSGAELVEIALGLSTPLASGGVIGLTFDAHALAQSGGLVAETAIVYETGNSVEERRSRQVVHSAGPLHLWLAASAPVANVTADGSPDGTADVKFQMQLRNPQSRSLYDVAMLLPLSSVRGLGAYTPALRPSVGQYTVLPQSVRLVEMVGSGTSASINPAFNGLAGNPNLLRPGSLLGEGGSLTVEVVARFHLDAAPTQLQARAQASASRHPGGPIDARALSRNGFPSAVGTAEISNGAQLATPFSGRPPQLKLNMLLESTQAVQGEPGSFDLTYALSIENIGRTDVGYVRLISNLQCAFQMGSPGGPVRAWKIMGAPVSDSADLPVMPGFTGAGPCDVNGHPALHAVTGLPHAPELALVDGPFTLLVGSEERLRLTARLTLQPSVSNVPLIKQQAWVAVVQPLADVPPHQIVNANDGAHAILWSSSAQVLSQVAMPTGTVYHALTRQPVAGARVTVQRSGCSSATDAALAEGDLLGTGNIQYHADGTASTVTDAQGRYFLSPNANANARAGVCTYTLHVAGPIGSGLAFPSNVIEPQAGVFESCGAVSARNSAPQSGDDSTYFTQISQGTDGQTGAACTVYHNHIPLDLQAQQGLSLQKRAESKQVELGDLVGYELQLTNYTGSSLDGVQLTDALPIGLRYAPGSVTIDGAALAEPVQGPPNTMEFVLPLMSPGATTTLRYFARAGVGAEIGASLVNRAWATATIGQGLVRSNTASASIRVDGGVFSEAAFAFGKVFGDCNANGLQDDLERGLPNVRLFLEDGTSVFTDSDGRWSLPGLRPLSHAVRLDESTLAPGTAPQLSHQRQLGVPTSQWLDLKKGEWRKVNFGVGPCATPEVSPSAAAQSRPSVGSPTAEQSLEEAVAGRMVTPQFLSFNGPSVLPGSVAHVRVMGPLRHKLTLLLNGVEVERSRIGQQLEDPSRDLQARDYVALRLRAGDNRLELQTTDETGATQTHAQQLLTAPGAVAKIELSYPASAAANVRSEVVLNVRLTDAQGVALVDQTPVTLELQGAKWKLSDASPHTSNVSIFVDGGAIALHMEPPAQPGEARFKVTAGGVTQTGRIIFVPDLRPLIGVGILEGVFHLDRRAPLLVGQAPAGAAFESELRAWSQDDGQATGRSAFYFKGAVKGAYLLTLAFDSEKPARTPLFKEIEPDRYYPVYGDESTRQVDAQSSQRLYLRVDHNRSYLLVGDYHVDSGSGTDAVRRLSRTNRRQSGVQQVFQGDSTRVSSHISQGTTRQQTQEFVANGTSGPFMLHAPGDVVEQSEWVEIVVRDRYQPNIVVRTTTLARFVHYNLDVFSQSLLLTAPVASLDADLNLQSIRVRYSVESGGAAYWVGGVAAERQITDAVKLGAVVERDELPGSATEMRAVTLTHQLNAQTQLSSEWVTTESDEQGAGQARGLQLAHQSAGLNYQLQSHSSDENFHNPDAGVIAGATESQAQLALDLRPDVQLRAKVHHTEISRSSAPHTRSSPAAHGGAASGAQVLLHHTLSPHVQADWGVQIGSTPAASLGNFDYAVAPGASAPARYLVQNNGLHEPANDQRTGLWRLTMNPKQSQGVGLFVEGEQSLDDADRRMTALGANFAGPRSLRLYGRYESRTGLEWLNGVQEPRLMRRDIGILGIDSPYRSSGRIYEELRVRERDDGSSWQSAMGVRDSWPLTDGLRLTGGVERQTGWSSDDNDSAGEAVVVTSGLDWTGRGPLLNRWRGSVSTEWREAMDRKTRLTAASAAYKINAVWSLLGKAQITSVAHDAGMTHRWQGRQQIGLAYRPVGDDTWNALFRYERRHDHTQAALARLNKRRLTHIGSAHFNYQPRVADQFSTRLAARQSEDQRGAWRDRYAAALWHSRWTHEWRADWDAGLQGGLWLDQHGTQQRTVGAEVGHTLAPGFWLSVGYNFIGLRDAELAGADYIDTGWYLRLRFKFDERSLSQVRSTEDRP